MSGHPETGGEFNTVEVLRKRVAVVNASIMLAIFCPFLAIPVIGEMIVSSHTAALDEATLESGSHH